MKKSIWILTLLLILHLALLMGCGDDKPKGIVSPANQKPIINGYTMSPACDPEYYLPWGSETIIGIMARDPDDDSLQYLWSENGDGFFKTEKTSQEIIWKSQEFSRDGGIYSIDCIVSDGELSDSLTVYVYIAPYFE